MGKSTCSIDGCAKSAHRAGRCAAHYAAALAAGECGKAKPCIWPGCDLLGTSRKFCGTHYYRAKTVKEFDAPWIAWEARQAERAQAQANKRCRWPECGESKIHGQGLCKDCYRRAGIVGDMKEPWKLWNPGGHCVVCGVWTDGAIHGQRFCSTACNMKDWKVRNAERVRELGREHSRRRRAQIYATRIENFTDADVRLSRGDDCYLCGERIDFKLKFPHPKSPSLDHVIPLSRGGTHTLENASMVHYVCNQIKGVKDAPNLPQRTLLAI